MIKAGDLIMVIDEFGSEVGKGIYVEDVIPGNENQIYWDRIAVNKLSRHSGYLYPSHHHKKVMINGELVYYNNSYYTLIELAK